MSPPPHSQLAPVSARLAGRAAVCTIFLLVAVALYMALAFPRLLQGLKQAETSELRALLVVGRAGEPSPAHVGPLFGAPSDGAGLAGLGQPADQLTGQGKRRMYMLGKFLKLRYYRLLLDGGNPRRLYARAADTDRCLESAQALLAGFSPPSPRWHWLGPQWAAEPGADQASESAGGPPGPPIGARGSSGVAAVPAAETASAAAPSAGSGPAAGSQEAIDLMLAHSWQPKAVHTAEQPYDDLLAAEPNCFRLDSDRASWKNSSRYAQLLNEFRHDMSTLRTNTGLEFEDDLELLGAIEGALRARKALGAPLPAWYSSTFADRLARIADVATESRYSSPDSQRLVAGRLLHEIAHNIGAKIRQASGPQQPATQQQQAAAATAAASGQPGLGPANRIAPAIGPDGELAAHLTAPGPASGATTTTTSRTELPNVFVYITSKQRLAALLSSLQVYTSAPDFGALLLIELHYQPIEQTYFVRLFLISSPDPTVFPEPLRLSPVACAPDSAECPAQQFEQNIRHLMLDRSSWIDLCLNTLPVATTRAPPPQPSPTVVASASDSAPAKLDEPSEGPQTLLQALHAPTPIESPQPPPPPPPEAPQPLGASQRRLPLAAIREY